MPVVVDNLTKQETESRYITRYEIAEQLGVSYKAVQQSFRRGKIPGPIVQVGQHVFYDREIVEAWIKKKKASTNMTIYEEKIKDKDLYGIRASKMPFVYSGRTLMHILFCQPALRNGRHTYEDCK